MILRFPWWLQISSDDSTFPFVPIESEIPVENEISSNYSLVYTMKTDNNEIITLNCLFQFDYKVLY